MSKPQPEITSTYEPSPEPYPAVPSNATAAASTIPDELPPRPHTTSRSGLRDFFTFKFLRSYSLRGLGTDTRKRWRRILMITTLLILTATAIADFILLFLIGLTTFGIVFLVIDVVFIWTTAWSLAVIGDSVGTKRACGLTFGRTFFDVFLGVVCFLYCLWFILEWVSFGLWGFEGGWIGTGLLIFIVAWIASEPPVYPNDVV